MRKEKFLKKKFEDVQWKNEREAFAKEAEATKAEGNGRRISTTDTPLWGLTGACPSSSVSANQLCLISPLPWLK